MSIYPEAKHAFAVNPLGPVPYSGYQVFGIFLVAFAPVTALAACGLRVYSRRLSNGLGLHTDDWLIFLATAVFATLFIRAGYWGIHDADIPQHPWNQGLFWSYLNRVFYSPLLALRCVRLACKILIAFCFAQMLAFLPATIFMCEPVQYAWHGSREGRCFRPGYFSVTLASTNIITDIMALLIPFCAFLSLKLVNKIRFALLGVFALGAAVTLVSVLRLYFIIRLWYLDPEDAHYSLGFSLNTLEVNLAIVTATLPTLWPLGRHWFPAMFESMGLNRPYLYPDIERTAGPGAGAGAQASPALRGRILWLQRPRPPSFLHPTTADEGLAGGESGGSSLGLTDIRGQRVFGTSVGSRSRSAVGDDGEGDGDEDEDGLDDYHGTMRQTKPDRGHEEDDSLTDHQFPGSEAASSSSDIRS
ncbi:hypothetical protein C8A00DRAFT_40604 [Chaetomidium leptoderma]|uniref:Rhodopsin domain-containing protein n=1 Tax=Chaetomidium leptoderma TaxID=669021 RepID=A0AAN6VVM8_9PEZI|nr:hypothetical protein C8A00DRAFT_40604 [Chaetomidium leptoderma]